MRMKSDTARCNPSASFYLSEFKNQTSAQLRLREENMGELDPIPCENDFPLRIRFEAGLRNQKPFHESYSDSKEVSLHLKFAHSFGSCHVRFRMFISSSDKDRGNLWWCDFGDHFIVSWRFFWSEVGTAFRCRKAQKRMTKVWLLRIAFTWAEGLWGWSVPTFTP